MLYYNVQSISFNEKAAWLITDKDGCGLQVEKSNRQSFWFNGEMKHIRSRDQPNAAIWFSNEPATIDKIADCSNKLISLRSKNVLFRVSIDPWWSILALPHSIQVKENCFDVFLVLKEKRALYCFANTVHLLKTHFFLLLV